MTELSIDINTIKGFLDPEEGDALYKSLMNPQTSSVLLQELQDRKKYEEGKGNQE